MRLGAAHHYGAMRCWATVSMLLALALPLSPSAAQAADGEAMQLLDNLVGKWSGRGKLRQKLDAPEEPIKCKFTGKRSGEEVSLRYVCIGVGLRLTSRGTIVAEGERYSGKLKTTGLGSAEISGGPIGNAIALILDGKHPKTKEKTRDELILRIDEDGFRMEIKAEDNDSGEKFIAFKAKFED